MGRRYFVATDEHGYINQEGIRALPEIIGEPQVLPAVKDPDVGIPGLLHAYSHPSEAIFESPDALWPVRLFTLEGTPVASEGTEHAFSAFTEDARLMCDAGESELEEPASK